MTHLPLLPTHHCYRHTHHCCRHPPLLHDTPTTVANTHHCCMAHPPLLHDKPVMHCCTTRPPCTVARHTHHNRLQGMSPKSTVVLEECSCSKPVPVRVTTVPPDTVLSTEEIPWKAARKARKRSSGRNAINPVGADRC